MLLKAERRFDERKAALRSRHCGQALALADGFWQLLAAQSCQARLRVEGLDLRRAAGLKQPNYALRFGREVRKSTESAGGRRVRRVRQVASQQVCQGDGADAARGAAEEVAARCELLDGCRSLQCLVIVSSRLSTRLAKPM